MRAVSTAADAVVGGPGPEQELDYREVSKFQLRRDQVRSLRAAGVPLGLTGRLFPMPCPLAAPGRSCEGTEAGPDSTLRPRRTGSGGQASPLTASFCQLVLSRGVHLSVTAVTQSTLFPQHPVPV